MSSRTILPAAGLALVASELLRDRGNDLDVIELRKGHMLPPSIDCTRVVLEAPRRAERRRPVTRIEDATDVQRCILFPAKALPPEPPRPLTKRQRRRLRGKR